MSNQIEEFKDDLTWEEKARLNPLFAVMSDEVFKDSGTEFNEQQLKTFYEQGERFWKKWLRQMLWDKSEDEIRNTSILEYGCGMGRIINQAAAMGMKAAGLDISSSQLEYARNFCPNAKNIDFLLLDEKGAIPVGDGAFDIVYSYAVLQHIKQSSALESAISEICRVVKKGGLVRVQVRSQHAYLSYLQYKWFHSINLETSSWCFYLRKTGPIYLPVIRKNKHTNWVGACANYSIATLLKRFSSQGVAVNQIEFDAENKLVWLTGIKK
jgi:ubiquinone/menaquinone biosynthesis C-methylase UbiE